jgi:hypothetical protein
VAAFLGRSWDLPPREVRTRTAIDPQRGAADEARLFSYAAVVPDGFRWRSVLSAPDDVDAAALDELLQFLAAGVGWIGKTAAVMQDVVIVEAGEPPIAAVAGGDARYALVLETPALLADIESLRSGVSAFDDYGRYFTGLGWKLHRHFARERLVGGHLALRYPPAADRYEMYLLSEPGSVFLIEPRDGPHHQPLDALLKFGLPPRLPDGLAHWRRCPFLRENGFGQVRCHTVDPEAASAAGKRVELSAP